MILVIIPARGGSKGVPGKNIKPLNGKPLIFYTIEAAKEVFDIEDILVSTDSEEIKLKVEETGLKVPFLRPNYLSTDMANTQDVILHAMGYVESRGRSVEVIILLQPTSPFRTGDHIKEALNLYNNSIDMVVSVKETEANPYYLLKEEDANGFLIPAKKGSFTRRQDCPKVWELNGAIYIINPVSLKEKIISDFKKVKKYEMDSSSSIDIDSPLDWKLAEFLGKTK